MSLSNFGDYLRNREGRVILVGWTITIFAHLLAEYQD